MQRWWAGSRATQRPLAGHGQVGLGLDGQDLVQGASDPAGRLRCPCERPQHVGLRDDADQVLAVEHGQRGIYNVVDDEPAPVAEWLPAMAESIGAPRPWHVPRFVGRLLAGEAGAVMMTETRGASNAKAKRDLGWEPRHPSWREGLAA